MTRLIRPYFFFALCLAQGLIQGLTLLSASAKVVEVSLQSECAILMNATTGKILYEKNSHKECYPASITKIATALYTLKKQRDILDTVVFASADSVGAISQEALRRSNYTLPAYWLVHGGCHIGIKKGEGLSIKDLLYGMLVSSGNDASNVIAEHIGGTIPKFIEGMNAYLKEIGCQDTLFYNPHGLYHPNHVTTAWDMAIITRKALEDPIFAQIVGTVRYTRPKTNKQDSTILVQTNRLLRNGKHYYSKAIGVKTGYIAAASNTFVGAARDGDRTLIAVLMNCKGRDVIFNDCVTLFEAAFNEPKMRKTLLKKGQQKFALQLANGNIPLKTYTKSDLVVEYYPAEEPKVKCILKWAGKLEPTIQQHDEVGEIAVIDENGKVLNKMPLLAAEKVEPKPLFWMESKIKQFAANPLSGSPKKPLLIAAIFLVLISIFFFVRRRR